MSQQIEPAVVLDLTRFATVGAVGFVIDGGILTLMMSRGHAPFESRLVSFTFAVTVTWALNRTWTFSRARRKERWREYLAYVLTQVAGAGLNLGVFFMLLQLYPTMRVYPLVPLAAGAAVALVFNFAASKHIVYRGAARRPCGSDTE